jgi:hypothetical protein
MTEETAHSRRVVLAVARADIISKHARMLGVVVFAIVTSTIDATAPIGNLALLAVFAALPAGGFCYYWLSQRG